MPAPITKTWRSSDAESADEGVPVEDWDWLSPTDGSDV
jgi:hypothetical protein